jgi:hypothetical protein
MSFNVVFAIGTVLIALLVAGYAIWQYGPGPRERSVLCPVLKKRAEVLIDQREAGFFCSYAGLEAVNLGRPWRACSTMTFSTAALSALSARSAAALRLPTQLSLYR